MRKLLSKISLPLGLGLQSLPLGLGLQSLPLRLGLLLLPLGLGLLGLSGSSFAQSPTADSTWMATHYTKKEVSIPMRDGKKLFTAIYEPVEHTKKHPILINRTPYSVAPYGPAFKAFWTTHYMAYFKENYIIVLQDVRGRYMSEGDFVDVRPYNDHKQGKEIDEASDTYDTIDWLIKSVKNNNGKVGVWGISYPGFYATEAALCGHPALKAVSPQAPVTDWFMGDDFHHNGAFMEMDAFSFYSGFGKPRHEITKTGASGYQYNTKDNYKFYLDNGSLKNLAALTGDSLQFWNDIYAHPNYDKWWKARNARSQVQHIPDNVATLVVGGEFDAEDCFGAWNLYKAIEQKANNNNRLIIGPWSHGGWARTTGEYLGNVRFLSNTSEVYHGLEESFFDYYLLGKGDINDKKQSPTTYMHKASVFFTGENDWQYFNKWPPENKTDMPLYLQPGGGLSGAEPTADDNSGYAKYTSDPAKPVPYSEEVHFARTKEYMTDDQRFAARRPDVLVYQSDVLEENTRMGGPVIADLFTSLSTTDADFVVKIIDVFPDDFAYNEKQDGKGGNGRNYPMGGYEMLVRGEVMRGRYCNSFEKPEAFTPGQPTEVKYKLPDIAHTFMKGHRIMVQIQSTWFPLVDRNPQQFVDIYHCDNKDFVPCDIKIYSSKEHPSKIVLPVIK